jgi:O-antigen chain-terminating methyltransferase
VSVLEKTFKALGNVKVRKMKLNSGLLKVAAYFVDYESEHLPPDSRIVEDSFVFSKLLTMSPRRVLDVGCVARHNYISPSLAMNNWDVYGIDIRTEWEFHHPNFHFIQKDVRQSGFSDGYFDLIICISAMEHIGLLGYYGNQLKISEGDAEAMKEMERILRRKGTLLLTVPFCDDYLERAGARVYDHARLHGMMNGMRINDSVIYHQDKKGGWYPVSNSPTEGVICLEIVKD